MTSEEQKNIDKTKIILRPIQDHDLKPTFNLLESLGWQFSLSELRCWFDNESLRNGYTILEYDGEFVGSINVVNSNDNYAFIGYFVIRSEFRNQGLGKILWNEGVKKAGNKELMLATTDDLFSFYERKGFQTSKNCPTIRHVCCCKFNVNGADKTVHVREISKDDTNEISDYDADVYKQVSRREYLTQWLLSDKTTSLVARKEGQIVGFLVGTLYKDNLYKIGPLEADSPGITKALIQEYLLSIPSDSIFVAEFLESNDLVEDLFDKDSEYRVEKPFYVLSTDGGDCRPEKEGKIWFISNVGIYRA